MEEYLHKTLIDAATPDMTFEELYYFMNDFLTKLTTEERVYEICNIQSIGASIQNMLLAATEKGIGSFWICDIYFAFSELCKMQSRETM